MPLTVCGFVGLNSGEELLRVTLNPSLSCTSLEGSSPKKNNHRTSRTWTVFSGRGGGDDGVVLTDSYVSMTGKSQRIIMPGHQEMRSSAWKKEVTHITENS